MGTLQLQFQLNPYAFRSNLTRTMTKFSGKNIGITRRRTTRATIRAVETIPDSETETTTTSVEPPMVNFAFVSVSQLFLLNDSRTDNRASVPFLPLILVRDVAAPAITLFFFCYVSYVCSRYCSRMEHRTCILEVLAGDRSLGTLCLILIWSYMDLM